MAESKENNQNQERQKDALLGLMQTMLDMIGSSAVIYEKTNPKFTKYCDDFKKDLESKINQTPTAIKISEREVRATDYIKDGEFPGFWIILDYEDGTRIDLNIHGGIRDVHGTSEYKDTAHGAQIGSTHSDRTLGLGDKITQFNLQVRSGGMIDQELWVNDRPGDRKAVYINSMRTLQSDKGYEGLPDFDLNRIMFPEGDNKTMYYYKAFHKSLDSVVSTLIDIIR